MCVCVCVFCVCRVHTELIVSFWNRAEQSKTEYKIASRTIKALAKRCRVLLFFLVRYSTYYSHCNKRTKRWMAKKKLSLDFRFQFNLISIGIFVCTRIQSMQMIFTICDAYIPDHFMVAYSPFSRFIHLNFVWCILSLLFLFFIFFRVSTQFLLKCNKII